MPFKNITAPRRVADLGAEVKSSAFLATPGLYAALTNDPVRLAVQPVSGGNTRVTNVSIDAAEEVAFITRDVVVVRAGDDSVWALIDITHTPKMEQVARDVRALCMRPTGESALALGWDGSATALTLAQHEVAARPFPLRGTLRAADVLVSETVVVVDAGGEGGELRIHPGATPEPGTPGDGSGTPGSGGWADQAPFADDCIARGGRYYRDATGHGCVLADGSSTDCTFDGQCPDGTSACRPGTAGLPVDAVLFDTSDRGALKQKPKYVPRFTISEPQVVTLVETYHHNGGKGATPGTISLLGQDGTLYGPWKATGRASADLEDAYWFVEPWLELPPGTYTVVDSQPGTWAQSTWTKGVGYVTVRGHPVP